MKATWTWVAGSAFLALTAVSAQADCAAELARMTGGEPAHEGISKDGSLAPLEQPDDAASAGGSAMPADSASSGSADAADSGGSASADSSTMAADGASLGAAGATESDGVAKDGSHVPLEGESGMQAGVAMSGNDAEAMQDGQPSAAQEATGESVGMDQSSREIHIQAARDALAAGDEDACMKALEAAQAM